METFSDISGSQYLKKDHISTNVDSNKQTHHVDSALKRSGNDRFHVVSTWNLCWVFVGWEPNLWLVKTIFFRFLDISQLLSVKVFFPSTGSYFLANPSFRLVETCFLFVGKSVFKDKPYSCYGNLFFYPSFTWRKRIFCVVEKIFFWSELYCC